MSSTKSHAERRYPAVSASDSAAVNTIRRKARETFVRCTERVAACWAPILVMATANHYRISLFQPETKQIYLVLLWLTD